MFKKFENLPFEKVCMMFCKSILGVNRKACNAGVRGELGFLPAYVDVIIAMFNYCKRLENLEKGCLLESIYRLCVNGDDCGTFTWYSGIKDLCLNTLGASVQHMCNMSKTEIWLC